MTARALVVDDNLAVLDSIAGRLAIAGIDVTTYNDGRRFLGEADFASADCLLLDVRMPGIDGIDILRDVKPRAPALPVIIMTGHGDIQLAVTAMKAGAYDFIEKPFSDAQLLSSVTSAIENASQQRVARVAAMAARRDVKLLTPREREVMKLIVEGKPNKIIAHELGCGQRTIEIHRARVMHKMNVSSLAELVRRAMLAEANAGR